jgi:hypothetical protein
VRRNLGFRPDASQAAVLDSPARRVLLNCTRQWGKSTVGAAKAVYEAQRQNDRLILIVNPALRQSREFMRKVEGFANLLPNHRTAEFRKDRDHTSWLELPNHSRIVGLGSNADAARGFSAVSLLIIDEAARISDDLYKTVRPLLSVSGGSLWLMGTPFGKRGFFYELWESGGPEWLRVQVPATRCRRIAAAFLREERRAIGTRWFSQEYLCRFAEVEEGLFDPDLVRKAFRKEVEPLALF